MKKFLKKYLWLIVVSFVSFMLIMLSVLWAGFFALGALILSVTFFVLAWKAKQKYNKLKDFSEEDLYFDATKYDYDEDVYYIGDGKSASKTIRKGFFSRFNARMPVVVCIILGLAFLSFAVMAITAVFFS